MTNYSEYFHPELEAVLEDIAKDPKAKLLQVPSSGQLVCAARNDRVGVAAPGLSAAEVELLTVHRETMGELLKQRCLIEFFAQPDADVRWHRSVTVDRRLEVRDEADWTDEVREIVALPVEDERSALAKDVLAKCITGDPHRRVSIAQLATTMLRVDPMDQAFVYEGLELFRQERYAASQEVASHVLGASSRLLESYATDLVGACLEMKGKPNEALDVYEQSHRICTQRANPIMSCLSIALLNGLELQARKFASALNGLLSTEHPDLESHCRTLKARVSERTSLLTAMGREVAASVREEFDGTSAGRIASAL